jgi:8-oxo-dGTP pyrophosphatase MutT (NUDIX family)
MSSSSSSSSSYRNRPAYNKQQQQQQQQQQKQKHKPPGAAVIIWYTEGDGSIKILLGKESVYVSDWYTELDETKQTAPQNVTTYPAACDIFKKRAQELENNPKFISAMGEQSEVRYDHPKINKEGKYGVIFRCLKFPQSKWGIVKGQKDKEDATTVETIKREIFEEVGIHPKHLQSHVWTPMKFKVDNYNVYTWKVNPVEQSMIRRCIGERKEEKHGELFDMAFLPWEEVQNYTINDSNSKSLTAFQGFKTYLETLPAEALPAEALASTTAAAVEFPKSRSSRSSSSTKRKRSLSQDKTASIKGGKRNNKRRTRRKKRNRWIM